MTLTNINQDYPYSVVAARVSRWNQQTQTYTNPSVAMASLQGIDFKPNRATDKRYSFGKTEGMLSILEDIEIKLNVTGMDYPAMTEMTGRTVTDSGSGALQTSDFNAGGGGFSYFGISVAMPSDNGGQIHLLCPYVMLNDDIWNITAERNKFVVSEVTATGMTLRLSNNTILLPGRLVRFPAPTALETNFNLWKTTLLTA
jgi:hypothetical protein